MRIDLSEFQAGAYAEILDRLPWKVLKAGARVNRETVSKDETDQINDLALKTMVRAWNVKDVLGENVPLPASATEDQIDMIDGMIIGRILSEIMKLTHGVRIDPNSGTALSMS